MPIRHRCWAAVWGLSVMEAEGPHLALQPGFAAGSHEAGRVCSPLGLSFLTARGSWPRLKGALRHQRDAHLPARGLRS